jgi:hypothetical protein
LIAVLPQIQSPEESFDDIDALSFFHGAVEKHRKCLSPSLLGHTINLRLRKQLSRRQCLKDAPHRVGVGQSGIGQSVV